MAMTAPNTMFTRTLAPTRALGALQRDLELILDGATKATSFTAVAVETSISTAPSITAGTSGIRSTENFPMLRFKFGLRDAAGTDGKTGNYKVVLYSRAATVVDGADAVPLVPEVVATGVITAGTLIYSDDIGSATATVGDMWADTITLTSNAIGVAKHSPADNTPATLMVDTRGACAYQVFVYLGSSTDAIDVWCQRSGTLNPFDLLTDLSARLGLGYSADGGSDIGDSVYADMQAMARWNDWRMAYKVWAPAGVASTSLFTITGRVEYQLMAEVVTSCDGAAGATIKLKTTGGDSAGDLIAATSAIEAGDLDAPHLWYDTTPTTDSDASATCWLAARTSYRNDAIQGQVEVAAVSSGTILVIVRWRPIPDSSAIPGSLVAA